MDPISIDFAGARVHELPPNGQGIATLIALGIMRALGWQDAPPDDVRTIHLALEATKLALADLAQYVADPARMAVAPAELLDPAYLAARAALIDPARAGSPVFGRPRPGGTVLVTAGDAQGRMISLIQSNYMGFGSGVVVPGTGISLQNRGAGFVLTPGHANRVGPRQRPFHTIIPGFATAADGSALMAFGVMGGPIQAQGHVQMALRVLGHGQNPQAAADAPRWRLTGGRGVAVEREIGEATIEALRALGHEVVVEAPEAVFAFGGAQLIVASEAGYVGGSDPRKDGQAVAF